MVEGVLLNVSFIPGLAELEPVDGIFHQQLAWPFERIVLALRMALPVFGHENPEAIGMPGEVDAEQVEHFALEPVRGRPDARDRCKRRVLGDDHLDAHAMTMTRG